MPRALTVGLAAGRLALGFLAALAVLVAPPGPSRAASFTTVRVANNLSYPVYVAAPPGDTDRLFIVGRLGTIRILDLASGVVDPSPFLDITSMVVSTGAEQGLLGLAFDPDYAANGHFYVYYTAGAGSSVSRVERYTVSADPDSADAASAFPIFQHPQPSAQHNGGTIHFGPEGNLWLGLGDGGGGAGPAQDPLQLLGKMLRVDPRSDAFPGDPSNNYAIPSTPTPNPFVGDPGTRDEIWALGFRNPYRWSFDSSTEDLYIGDVGEFTWEEVDFEPWATPGRNYGWPIMEADTCRVPASPACTDGSLTGPVHSYEHTAGCNSITGGSVYRGAAIPELVGQYLFADYCQLPAAVWSLEMVGGVATNLTDRSADLDPGGGLSLSFLAAVAPDAAGELYLVEFRASTGEIFKIVPDSAAVDVPAVGPSDPKPAILALELAGENPTGAATRLVLRLERRTSVDVAVYDAGGRLVRRLLDGEAGPGPLPVVWDGRDDAGARVPAGVSFVRAVAGGESVSRRIVRVR